MGTALSAAGAVAGTGAKLAGSPQGVSHDTRSAPFSGALRGASQRGASSQDGTAAHGSSASYRVPAHHDAPVPYDTLASHRTPTAHHATSAAHSASPTRSTPASLGASANGATPCTRITALLSSGMAFQAVVGRVASAVTDVVQKLSSGGNSGDRIALTRAVRSSLSPPGGAPPGMTVAERATALARHVTSIVTAVARGAQAAGQQNEISGRVLDAAATAKDLPAQSGLTTAPNAAASLAQILLAQIAAELQGSGAAPFTAAQTGAAAGTASAPPSETMIQIPVPSSGASRGVSARSSAPDLLGRMIARAAGGDARLNGRTPVAVTPGAPPRLSFARLIAAVENGADDAQAQALPQTSAHGSDDRTESSDVLAVPGATALAPSANASGASAAPAANASTPAPQAYDAEAILAQVVKGIVVRSGGGTQQIRLRLQPENLGEVSLRLTIDGSSVNAAVTAQNVGVRDVLLANQTQLARAFSDAGLQLGGFSVDVSGGNAQNDDGRRGDALTQRFAIHASGTPSGIGSNAPGDTVSPTTGVGLLEYFV